MGLQFLGARARMDTVRALVDQHKSKRLWRDNSISPLDPVLRWAYGKPNLFPRVLDLAIWPVALSAGAVLKLVFATSEVGPQLDQVLARARA